MAKAKQVIQESIKGVFEEDVNVGDKVMVVTKGRGSVRINKGTYIGFVDGKDYGRTVKKAVIEIDAKRHANFFPDGREFNWRTDYDSTTYDQIKGTLTMRQVPYTRRTTLKLNRIATLK